MSKLRIGMVCVMAGLGIGRASVAQQDPVHSTPVRALPEQAEGFRKQQQAWALFRADRPRAERIALDTTPVLLPFFDDFDTTDGTPGPERWVENSGVFVGQRFAWRPPSLRRVATFDGIRVDGQPYSFNPRAAGSCDTLTSRYINLDILSAADRESVYLTYYLQPGGREVELRPDLTDSLICQFKGPSGTWTTVRKDSGGKADHRFKPIALRVADSLCHRRFQFRFINYGQRSGAYDIWNLDYVYLDAPRAITDTTAQELAFQDEPGPLFGPYRAIPYKYLHERRPFLSTGDSARFFNFNDDLITFNIRFDISALEQTGRRSLLEIGTGASNIAGTDRPALPRESRQVSANPALVVQGLTDPATVLPDGPGDLLYRYYLVEDPRFNERKENDTVQAIAPVRDYLAYDDGTYEKSFFVFGNKGRVLLRYILPPGRSDTLVGLSFGLDPLTFTTNAVVPMDLIVYKTLVGIDGARRDSSLYFESKSLTANGGGLYYFPLRRGITVADTFYVGYRQGDGNENTVHVSADINSDARGTIFYNVLNSWERYVQSPNAWAMRPHFGCGGFCPVAVRERAARPVLRPIPNPARPGQALRLEGTGYTRLLLQDLAGRTLAAHTVAPGEAHPTLSLPAGLRAGLYVLQATQRDGSVETGRVEIR